MCRILKIIIKCHDRSNCGHGTVWPVAGEWGGGWRLAPKEKRTGEEGFGLALKQKKGKRVAVEANKLSSKTLLSGRKKFLKFSVHYIYIF